MPLRSGTRLGKYEILSLLGSGGMGEVYRARDIQLTRIVAIKVLPQLSLDPDRLRRFEQEARAMAALNHPNILAIFQFGEHEGIPYLVSELLEGETLRELLCHGVLPSRKVIEYAAQIAEGLSAAHVRGIVHRDLKPENVFVTRDGRLKILDFGLAKLVKLHSTPEDSTLTAGTEQGMMLGTVGYMSPEQVRGQDTDQRTDIFALGAIMYEALAGTRAFRGATSADTLSATLREEPPPFTNTSSVPPSLDCIVRHCLEKKPEQRFQSAADLAFALKALSHPTPSAIPWKHTLLRRPTFLFGGILILLLLALGLYWFRGKQVDVKERVKERQLTHNTSENRILAAAISPDGRYLAYAERGALKLAGIDTGETHDIQLPEELLAQLSSVEWFPNGEKLLIETETQAEGNVIWTTSVFGGAPQKLRAHGSSAVASPDGLSIAFVSGEGHEIWVMGPNGENPRTILTSEGQPFSALAWSPAARRLAFAKRTPGETFQAGSIQTISVEGGQPNLVLSDAHLSAEDGLYWTADNRIIFSMSEMGLSSGSNFWGITADPQTGNPIGNPAKITNWGSQSVWNARVSRDGRRLVAIKGHSRSDVFVGELKQQGKSFDSAMLLTSSGGEDTPETWDPDSKSILFRSDRTGWNQIFRQRLPHGQPELLIQGPNDEREVEFSPDSAWILYFAAPYHKGDAEPKSAHLFRSPVSGGSPEQVLEHPWQEGQYFVHCPSRPSASCVLSRWEGNQLVFLEFDPVHGQRAELARTTFVQATHQVEERFSDLDWTISPDGSRIALKDGDLLGKQLRILDLSTHGERSLKLPNAGYIESLRFAAAGDALFAALRDSQDHIARIDFNGHSQILLSGGKNVWLSDPRPSPNGRYLAYAQHTSEDNAWLLENF
jgi:serine/threonine protein kinase